METWGETVIELRSRIQVPAALANADLLETAEARWSGVVEVRTSMHDLLFVPPGDPYPWVRYVKVSAAGDGFWFPQFDGVYRVELWLPAANDPRLAVLRSADKARENAPAVLDAFLMQLVGDDGTASAATLTDLEV